MFSTMNTKVTLKAVNGHRVYNFRVYYPDQGVRKTKMFKEKAVAEAWAEERREEIEELGAKNSHVTDEERRAVNMFRESLSEIDHRGASPRLTDAVRFYLDHLRQSHKSITCAELADRLLLRIQKEGRGRRHVDDVTSRLKRFTGTYGDWMACDISTDIIDEFIDDINLAGTTKRNYRSKLNQMFLYGVKVGVCDSNPVENAINPKGDDTDIGILTPRQVASLLSCANDVTTPGIAISFFAGLRTSEIERLDWADIDLEEGHINIKARNSKSARRRIVTITDNLKAWLLPHEQHEGRVIGSVPWRWRSGYLEARKGAKITEWAHNAGRHSFSSYHLAKHEDAGKTAFELGHTNQRIVYQHYRKLVKPKDAETYWSIAPLEAAKITNIKAQ